MNVSQQIKDYAKAAGCEYEVAALDGMIDTLHHSRTFNIAILGETNCGKTYLMNLLSGKEVRKPSMLSLDEAPLMVTFQEGTGKPGYEIIVLDALKTEQKSISFYEIPINLAIDYESRELLSMLEEMDAVIYILSAVTPMTASDMANITAVANKLPMLFYTSKADLLKDRQERETCFEYLRQQLSVLTEGAELLDGSQPDAAGILLKKLNGFSVGDLRTFHAARLKRQIKDLIISRLSQRMKDLDAEREKRELEKAAADDNYRTRLLIWNSLRVELLERESNIVKTVDKKIKEYEAAARGDLLQQMKSGGYGEEQIVHRLEATVEHELKNTVQAILPLVENQTGADAAWLVSEVNRKLGVQLSVEDGMTGWPPEAPTLADERDIAQKPSHRKLIAAAGSSILAGGAVLSSMALVPTCMVAIPASIVAVHFIQEGINEQKSYHTEMERLAAKICDQSFGQLSESFHRNIGLLYERFFEMIQKNTLEEEPDFDLDEIGQRKASVLHMIEALEGKPYGLTCTKEDEEHD